MRKLLIGGGVALLLLLAVVAQWPAREVAGLEMLGEADLVARGWTGTVWRGRAHDLHWRGVRLGQLEWRLSPLSVLLLSPTMDLALAGPELRAEGSVRSDLGGDLIEASAVTLTAPAAWLQHVLRQPFLRLDGELAAEFAQARFEAGLLRDLSGTTRWDDAVVHGNIEAALGSLRVDWQTADDVIVGTVSDQGGPLAASGTVQIANDMWQVDVTLSAPASQVAIRQALAVLGRPDASGAVRLVMTGPMVPIR